MQVITYEKRQPLGVVFLLMAKQLSVRATCGRKSVGCLIARGKVIISSGVNGPRTFKCGELGCDLSKPCNYAIHAEANAIKNAQDNNIDIRGTALYCTTAPCVDCAQLIIEAGIAIVNYSEDYRNNEGIALLTKNDIEVNKVNLWANIR